MPSLGKALYDYIESEEIINKARDVEESLIEKHRKLVNENVSFNVEEAESVYAAFQAIINHRARIDKTILKLEDAANVIKEYLKATYAKPISYQYQKGIQHQTYVFSIDKDGRIVHNRQQN